MPGAGGWLNHPGATSRVGAPSAMAAPAVVVVAAVVVAVVTGRTTTPRCHGACSAVAGGVW